MLLNNGICSTTDDSENSWRRIHLIETAAPYMADFDEPRDVNYDEMSNNILPEQKERNLDVAKYDTVFIGYPKMEYLNKSVYSA